MNRRDRTMIPVGTFEDQRRQDYEYWMSRLERERFLPLKNYDSFTMESLLSDDLTEFLR